MRSEIAARVFEAARRVVIQEGRAAVVLNADAQIVRKAYANEFLRIRDAVLKNCRHWFARDGRQLRGVAAGGISTTTADDVVVNVDGLSIRIVGSVVERVARSEVADDGDAGGVVVRNGVLEDFYIDTAAKSIYVKTLDEIGNSKSDSNKDSSSK